MHRSLDRLLLPADLEAWGHDLHRPECVVPNATGDVLVPDWRGGVTLIQANGTQYTWLAQDPPVALRPNAIACTPEGTFLIANLGDAGGVWRMDVDGHLTPFLTEVDGEPLPPANFVTVDAVGRAWISVSTRQSPRQRAWRSDVADGFVAVVDHRGARIVADGLHYTNEVRPDPTGKWLYVVETFGRRVVRYPVHTDASLGEREAVVTLGHGCFPDGFARDEEGALWVTSLVSNRLLRVTVTGAVETVLEETNSRWLEEVERAFAEGRMRAEHLGPIPGTRLQQLTSIGFGGPDGKTAFLGSLHASCLYRFRSPVPGVAPAFERFPL